MKQFFASLLCAVLLACGQTAVLAQTAATAPAAVTSCPPGSKLVSAYTKKDGTAVAAHCKKARHAKAGAMSNAGPAATPGAASNTVPAAPAVAAPATVNTSSNAAPDPAATTCPAGKHYVHGYTTKNGKTVAGYCRKSHKKAAATAN